MHKSISINTLCFAPDRLATLVDAVARLGAQGISPDLEQVKQIGAATAGRLFRDAGLQVATLTHRAFGIANQEDSSAGQERLLRTIDVAAEIGAQSITMTTGGRGFLSWDEAATRFAEAISPCAYAARQACILLSVEPTSHLYADASIAHRLSDTLCIARMAGIGVVIDIFACWNDADLDDAISHAGPLTSLVQVSDYIYGDRALPCRAVPGDGAIPLRNIVPSIVNAGFDGWFDLEIIGPRLQSEGESVGLKRAANYLGRLLCDAGLPND